MDSVFPPAAGRLSAGSGVSGSVWIVCSPHAAGRLSADFEVSASVWIVCFPLQKEQKNT